MSRIVCISNRVSLPDPETGQINAGGLAVGVKAALESNGGGIWFGWDGSVRKLNGKSRQITQMTCGDITFLTMPLREREYEDYYKGMANEHLWPMMHGLGQHIKARPNVYSVYRDVNRTFARRIRPFLQPDDLIWVHDYHLIPLGREFRALGIRNPIGYFHHIPIPSEEFIRGPQVPLFLKKQYSQLVRDLFDYDLVGFQTFRDLENFAVSLGQRPSVSERFRGERIRHEGKSACFGVFPISVETYDLALAARQNAERAPLLKTEGKTLIGAERLDYTKGLPHRLIGFHEFLEQHPEHRDGVQYTQITPLSRADIERYQTAIRDTRQVAAEIRDDFESEENRPLVYSEKGIPREELLGRLRSADVGLVTPLIDGQNLVAKEFLAVQDPRDPGMLVLSKYAGAAEELERLGVLCVDPTNPADIAEKINQALTMPLPARIETYRKTITHLYRYDIEHWTESFLNELIKAPGKTAWRSSRVSGNVPVFPIKPYNNHRF